MFIHVDRHGGNSMAQLAERPTVNRFYEQASSRSEQAKLCILDGAWLHRLALDCGADDAGLAEITRSGLESQREEILRDYSWTKSLPSLVVRMAREPVRGAPRSVVNLEFHRAGHRVNEICAAIVAKLGVRGLRAVNRRWASP
jgi:hypothetical protein